jgi:NAD(P)-dependent dehydrogenase (short-subunit alcohol dehydrogenase family)
MRITCRESRKTSLGDSREFSQAGARAWMNGKSKVVVITGASAGVGRATVRQFAEHGARIGLIARGIDGLKGAQREVEALGGKALVFPVDVGNPDRVEAAAAQIEADLGEIDIWINNAMVSVFSPVKEMTPEEFWRVTEVTYLGCVYGTLAALKRMEPRNRGTIVQIGSALAYRGIPLQAAYCAAKHAIQGFCDSLRCELIHDKSNVHLTMVQLPALNTPQFGWVKSRLPRKAQPVPPIFQPEVAAEAIYFAAHHPRREFYVGAPSVAVIVGNRFVPGLLDHYLADTGYASQQCNGPEDPNRPHNLWQPVPGDHGARGAFDSRARNWSPQLWTSEHRILVAIGGAALALLGVVAFCKNKSHFTT